jgi:hypothetical protein
MADIKGGLEIASIVNNDIMESCSSTGSEVSVHDLTQNFVYVIFFS